MVRAKFKVVSVTQTEGEQVVVNLEAVTDGEGNESWSKWTPSGSLTMTITNPSASAQFIVGAEFFLDFTLA